MNGLDDRAEDPVDPALPEHLQAISRRLWLDLVMRAEMTTYRMAVAVAMGRFGDADGSNVFPGMQKVADMAKVDEKTARGHVKALVGMGLLHLKRKGGGRGGATNGYRLTRPADLSQLPLWLDPEFNRVPAGAGFVPLAAEEHRAPTPAETTEHRAPTPAESPVDNPEYRASAPGETSVDNSGSEETPGVRHRNTGRSAPKHRALAPGDPKKTLKAPQNPARLPQVSTSPVAKIDETRQAIAMLVGDAEPNAWTPDVQPPAPRIVRATAGLVPAAGAHEAAIAYLGSIPGGARFFAGLAARQLTAEGIEPTPEAVAIRAAQLAANRHSESRSA